MSLFKSGHSLVYNILVSLLYSDEIDKSRVRSKGDDDFEFKDKDEEYTYHERTETTKTEKITSTKRRSGAKQQIDLRAAANQLQSSEAIVSAV